MVAPLLVRHAGGSYAVIVRDGVLADLQALIDERHPHARVAIIADTSVVAALGTPIPGASLFTFPAGETHKTRATWATLTDQLLAARYDRHTVVVAFGGGVTTDLAGFVAATYLRGVPWIAVPTTTLAMIDAAVGGKTGVDTEAGKNLVGAFHPPSEVMCDPATTRTLPMRSYREGLAEAVKHGVTLDERYADWIVSHASELMDRNPATLESLIRRSVEIKASIVSDDEHESDLRAVLNAGHTIAHAIERVTNYAVPHGEAVAVGLVCETRVAEAMGIARPGTAARVEAALAAVQLPVVMPTLDGDALLEAMASDKKNQRGIIRASLIESIGSMAPNGNEWSHPLDLNALRAILAH